MVPRFRQKDEYWLLNLLWLSQVMGTAELPATYCLIELGVERAARSGALPP
jgi:hypothetical protein